MSGQPNTSTLDYHETPYNDSNYEVVGEPPGEEIFLPLAVEVMKTDTRLEDPMFQSFGASPDQGEPARWHLPEGVGEGSPGDKRKVEERDDRVRLAQEELDGLIAEAEARGREAAVAETGAMIEQNNAMINERMTTMIKDIVGQLREHIADHEKQSVALALTVSRKIIDDAVEINPEYILPIIQEALGHAGGAQIKRIRVSAQDMEFIRIIKIQESLKAFDGTWDFEVDETINSGCIVDTSAGEIDYQIDKAWERVRDKVVKVIR